jgi:hypothetical protein
MDSAPPPAYQTTVFRAQPNEGGQRKIQKRNRPPVSCLLCRTRKVSNVKSAWGAPTLFASWSRRSLEPCVR